MATNKEKICLIAETYINIKGDATAMQIRDFIKNSTHKFQSSPTTAEISSALRRHNRFGHYEQKGNKPLVFYMER